MSKKKLLILSFLLISPLLSSAQTTTPWHAKLDPLKIGLKTEWQEMQAKRAESYGKMMVENLAFSQKRSQDLYNSVQEKVGEEATSSQKVLLIEEMGEIKVILDRNTGNINRLRLNLEPQNAPNADWRETKQLVRSIIINLRLSHRKIKEVLKLLD